MLQLSLTVLYIFTFALFFRELTSNPIISRTKVTLNMCFGKFMILSFFSYRLLASFRALRWIFLQKFRKMMSLHA